MRRSLAAANRVAPTSPVWRTLGIPMAKTTGCIGALFRSSEGAIGIPNVRRGGWLRDQPRRFDRAAASRGMTLI